MVIPLSATWGAGGWELSPDTTHNNVYANVYDNVYENVYDNV